MLQRTAMPSSISPVPLDLSGSIRTGLRNNPVGTVIRILSMPLDRTAFAWWLVILTLFGAGAGVHIWLSVQIAQSQNQLSVLTAEHTQIELDNAELMWQISQYTSLPMVQSRATSMGFHMDYENQYVPVAANLPAVVITTEPMVQALPTANPGNGAANQPTVGAGGTSDDASRINFGRLGISVQRIDWVQDLRLRTDGFFTDLGLGLDSLWSDLRAYGENALQRMAGGPSGSETIIATNR